MELGSFLQLFTFTAGTLLYLFLVVLLGGLRKPRLPESLLFFTWIGLFLFYAGGLLGLNALDEYASPPMATMLTAFLLAVTGMLLVPPLLVHSQTEFLARLQGRRESWMTPVAALFYLPALYFLFVFLPALATRGLFEALETVSAPPWRLGYGIWLALAFFASAGYQWAFGKRLSTPTYTGVARILGGIFLLGGAASVAASLRGPAGPQDMVLQALIALLVFLPVAAGGLLIYFLVRQGLQGTGLQRSLVYSVVLAFLALIYLTLARRLSVWLAPLGFPPEATVSILLFVFVLFIGPLQRRVAGVLERTFRRQAEKLQHVVAEIQQVARAGNLDGLVAFAELRVGEALDLTAVRLALREGPERPAASGRAARFVLRNGPEEIGVLEAFYYGETLSGETQAALEYLAEQLPAAVDLCRLLHEKVRLERELAQRERMAALGQAAASISHNLKNPLSSMKTLLQVQIENPNLPAEAKKDCAMAVAEVNRLSAKLAQLLKFAPPVVRPAARGASTVVSAGEVAEQVVALLRHGAERRSVKLEIQPAAEEIRVAATEEGLNDVLSNLVVNAIEAAPAGGTVRVELKRQDAHVLIQVTDDGPGIPPEMRERVFQPFHTTKPSGTGLGLAIVAKRLEELGGTITVESPVADGRGCRFIVTMPTL